jgi:hypothetical protein
MLAPVVGRPCPSYIASSIHVLMQSKSEAAFLEWQLNIPGVSKDSGIKMPQKEIG